MEIEQYKYWRLVDFLVTECQYKIIYLSEDQQEIWLEEQSGAIKYPVIRLFRIDLDWSNWLSRDMERTSLNAERIRRTLRNRSLKVESMYITAFPPVDSFVHLIDKPFISADKKVEIKTVLLDRSIEEWQLAGHTIADLNVVPDTEEERNEQIETYKEDVFTHIKQHEQEERQLLYFGKPFISYLFIAIQIIMFFLMEGSGGSTNSETLINWGAKVNYLIADGEWWRLITPIFLHIGILHLLMNSIALYYVGPLIERIFGNSRFLFIYLFAGFSGVFASYLLSPSLSAGASGAIFGCFGALLYFAWQFPKLFFRVMGWNVIIIIIINLIFGFTIQGIDNAGHIGGLVGGFLATAIVHFPKKKSWKIQLSALVMTFLLIGIGISYTASTAVLHRVDKSALKLVNNYINDEKYAQAEEVLNKVEFKNNENYYFLLSYIQLKNKEFAKAEQNLQKTIALNPQFHEAYYNLAVVSLYNEDLTKAREYIQTAIELDENNHKYLRLWDKIKE
ncbi:rhomboid family intramembrane serine protease [Niallia sp. RD1]|uniref:rhomboid family intramembrane serine protease n=1 Tax=Niallia sp. RD1 TaxID=2962858 RepID=UPI0020C191CE|nr:rhomboid family intramembrane serine protease [Niallia sp. RD1]UTI41719.1 rhomboid family intramembrane serine protease [Niallia sp. RD1]